MTGTVKYNIAYKIGKYKISIKIKAPERYGTGLP